MSTSPVTVYLKDYAVPSFLISTVHLDIDHQDTFTTVTATSKFSRNAASLEKNAPLKLDGELLELVSVSIDDRPLKASDYALDDKYLTIPSVPDAFTLKTVVRLQPKKNTQLSGLYGSSTGLFTQCEAEGFRRITFFLDRPDVMARYSATLHGNKAEYPLLLCNGNMVEQGDEANGRHFTKWVDPFPKPSYLFATVAAKLDQLADTYVTRSGRTVKLFVFVEPGKLDQCTFAMQALKKAMKWDEDVFGLEVDLDQYMIVAVADFNMGAMENKGLNIFNTKFVLASAATATDTDFMMLDRVVAHEYFHNWTGNRVTCRDWFQLSLKEGLTVFRDQEYGADMYSRAVQRIQEVRTLRAAQFVEDAGTMSHPVRPASYMEINNFYTATVYEKGAEVVRMIHTLIGAQKFRAGMDLYFKRHDGQAVRTEEFASAMQDASGVDLTQFKRWYEQPGTPVVTAAGVFDAAKKTYTVALTQENRGQPPLHIPFEMGLLDETGREFFLQLSTETTASGTTRLLSLTEKQATFTFINVASRPVPSLLRNFSAPVILKAEFTQDDLALLMAHDTDAFNRWEAGQRLAMQVLLTGLKAHSTGHQVDVPDSLVKAFRKVLADSASDPAFAADTITLPAPSYIAEQLSEVDAEAILHVRTAVRRHLAGALETEFAELYRTLAATGPESVTAAHSGRRALRNQCLGYLMELGTPAVRAKALLQLQSADTMTDAVAALSALANEDCPEREVALEKFFTKWKHEPLVMDKWFMVQASSRLPNTLQHVKALVKHPSFDITNPNKVRSVIGAFCSGNHARFNAADGSGYQFAADQIIALDAINPQVASRMARAFDRWRKVSPAVQVHAKKALERILATPKLSTDLTEIVTRALA